MAREVLSKKQQGKLLQYTQSILETKRRFMQFRNKLDSVDIAYACYQVANKDSIQAVDGVDIQRRLPSKDVQIPIIASQVDSIVAYLSEVFLSGYPIFPVVSSAKNIELSEKFEAIVDFHAFKGRYPRQLQILFRDAAKYNFYGMEARWTEIPSFTKPMSLDLKSQDSYGLTGLTRIDPYNAIWDYRVAPADVATKGEYGGYIELMSSVQLKSLLNQYSRKGTHMNVTEAMNGATADGSPLVPLYYDNKPQISNYVDSRAYANGATWAEYLAGTKTEPSVYPGFGNMYEVATIYARIIPSQLGMTVGAANSPQVWRLQIVNGNTLIYAQPESSPHDMLPVIFGQPIEDGFGYQTRGIGESQMPFQQAATDLYKTRLEGSKRALNDRGLYDAQMVRSADVNTVTPAAKIPVRNLKSGRTIRDAYHPIPFQDGSTVTALQDLQTTINMSNTMTGINSFRQGQPVKGNRTLGEFNQVDNSADQRSRLLALMIEVQLFVPIKEIIKYNILANKSDIPALNLNTGADASARPEDFVDAVLEFKLADGFTPKSKLASIQALELAFQTLQKLPELRLGYDIPLIFAHLMNEAGVKQLSQYAMSPDSKQAIMSKAMPYLQEMVAIAQAELGQQQ